VLWPIAFVIATSEPPVSDALAATDSPKTLRAAFTLEVTSGEALRIIRFDPRLTGPAMWQLTEAKGRNDSLDGVLEGWSVDTSADGLLFPDNLSERLGAFVDLQDAGAAWTVDFRPAVTGGDTSFDIQASQHLAGRVWLDPMSRRFVRVEYESVGRFRVDGVGRIDRLSQNYVLGQDREFGLSYVTAFELSFTAGRGPVTRSQTISARLLDVEFFFASPEALAAWQAGRD